MTFHNRHAGFLQETGNSFAKLVYDAGPAFDDAVEINFIFHFLHAEFFGITAQRNYSRVLDHAFRRNTACIQTSTSETATVDKNDLLAAFRGKKSSLIAAGTGAYDYKVSFHFAEALSAR